MTEAEWLNGTNPEEMLDFLPDRVSDRKLRLFACAYCRKVWDRISDEERRNIEVTERYVDGRATEEECRSFKWPVYQFRFGPKGIMLLDSQADTAARRWTSLAVLHQVVDLGALDHPEYDRIEREEASRQSDLLREILANPYRPVAVCLDILRWNDAVVVRLAQAAYDERHLPAGTLDNGRLAILADALEEAGCTEADILDHLRGPGPHVRGCWVVDLVLGKR